MQVQGEHYCDAGMNYSLAPIERGETEAVTVAIHDARGCALPFDECGFQCIDDPLPVEGYDSPLAAAADRPAHMADLARALSGCDRTVVYPAIARDPASAREVADYAPITFVHSDFTDDYRAMVQDPDRPYSAYIQPLLAQWGLDQEAVARADRVLMLQFWRNVGAPYPDHPLAFADARTVPRSDLLPFVVPEYGGARLEFETFGVRAPDDPSAHHWYTYPGLERDELLVFRTYDSLCAEAGRPFWTPHSAFRDPRAGDEAPARASVEIRVLCLFGVG